MERQNIFTGIKLLPKHPFSDQSNSQQRHDQNDQILSIKENNIIVKDKHNFKVFKFDCCLAKTSTQQEIYDNFCLSMVEDFIEGYDCTLIMCGDNKLNKGYNDIILGNDAEQTKGLLPRFIDHITNSVKHFSKRKFMFKVSFLEINDEELIDLLGVKKCKLQLKQVKKIKGQVQINNLEIKTLQKIDQIESFYLVGNRKRQYAYSKQHRKRENSTSFFTIYLQSLDQDGTVYRSSRYVFCELSANSFEESKSSISDEIFKKGFSLQTMQGSQYNRGHFQSRNQLNLSNYSFRNVVNTIVYGQQSVHVPFSDSKVTKILRQSLGGNQKTAILGIIETQNKGSLLKTFRILKTLQIAAQIENTPTNLKQIPSQQYNDDNLNIIHCLQQIYQLSAELDKSKLELSNLVNNSQYVPNQIQTLKQQKGHSLIQDNEFCSISNLQHRLTEQKTIKQTQLKQKIKTVQKNLKQKLSYIQNLNSDTNQSYYNNSNQNQSFNPQQIITNRKQILLRVKNIKEKRLRSIPNFDLQPLQRQVKRQAFALQIQFQKERNLFTSTIRVLQEKLAFHKKIAQSYLKKQEMEIIRINSKYDETKREFQLSTFMIKEMKTKGAPVISPMTSERKFIVSPRAKSFNSYHSISSMKGKKINQQRDYKNKMQNILARKPKKAEECSSQYEVDKVSGQQNCTNKDKNIRQSYEGKVTSGKVQQSKSPMNFNRIKSSRQNKTEHAKKVRTQYQILQAETNEYVKGDYQTEKFKMTQKQKLNQKSLSRPNPFYFMKNTSSYRDTQSKKLQQTRNKVISPSNSLNKNNPIRSPSNKLTI